MTERYTLQDLIYLMARLRDSETGCPWDIKQTYQTIAPYTLEEVYEVIDTIERNDTEHLREELGDLLFQVVFYAQLGKEEGIFEFPDIVHGIVAKLINRHPHVFPDGTLESSRSAGDHLATKQVKHNWEKLKEQERSAKGQKGILDDVPHALTALMRAQKLQKRASKAGFDWSQIKGVIAKVEEELGEVKDEIPDNNQQRLAEEMGDLLFSCVNLARHLGVDAETVLRQANRKFEQRFSTMEKLAQSSGQIFETLSPEAKEAFWALSKKENSQGL